MSGSSERSLVVVEIAEPESRSASPSPAPQSSRRDAYQFLVAAFVVEAVLWGKDT
jgi:hypothetical protein